MSLVDDITAAFGCEPKKLLPLSKGQVGDLYSVRMPDGKQYVAKTDDSESGTLHIEGFMLEYLAKHSSLPVPEVKFASPHLLLMQFMRGSTGCPPLCEAEVGRMLAVLHSVTAPQYGFERDTVIGGLQQPNPWCDSWLSFFAEHRLLSMGRRIFDMGRIGKRRMMQIERMAGSLNRWLEEPDKPSLLHGDMWSGNVLSSASRITGVLDPALYYGHSEAEVAFVTLFRTFGDRFFRAYEASRPLDDDFRDVRRHIYNVYPLMVHVHLVGGTYAEDLRGVLDRFV